MKKLMIAILALLLIGICIGGSFMIYRFDPQKKERFTETVNKKNEEKVEDGKEKNSVEVVDKNDEDVEKEQNINDSKEEEKQEESSKKNNNVKNTTSSNSSNSNSKKTSSTKTKDNSSTTKQNNNTTFSESNKTTSKNNSSTTTKKNKWDELGITEDEYYNSPMLKWQKVTHSSFEACQKDGENKVNDSNSEYTQFWCYDVYSYSGKKLGIMLKLS